MILDIWLACLRVVDMEGNVLGGNLEGRFYCIYTTNSRGTKIKGNSNNQII